MANAEQRKLWRDKWHKWLELDRTARKCAALDLILWESSRWAESVNPPRLLLPCGYQSLNVCFRNNYQQLRLRLRFRTLDSEGVAVRKLSIWMPLGKCVNVFQRRLWPVMSWADQANFIARERPDLIFFFFCDRIGLRETTRIKRLLK